MGRNRRARRQRQTVRVRHVFRHGPLLTSQQDGGTVSVQFGRWNFDGESVDPEYISRAKAMLVPYAPDSTTVFVKGPFFILHSAFHTTKESEAERQPSISPAGTYLTW